MVRRLTGVSAAPGYRVLTEAERSDPTKARAKLQTAGFDGAVVMRMVGRETRIEPAAPAMGYGAWGWGYQSYPVTDTIVRMETNVYSLIEGHLVWSGLSRTFDPESSRELVEEVSEAVAEELTKRGIVSPPTT